MKFLVQEMKVQLQLSEAEKENLQRRIEQACKDDKLHTRSLSE